MNYTIIITALWYISGLFSLAWAVKFNRKKIFEQFGLYLIGSLFGLFVLALVVLDNFIEKDEKKR
jgi:hypothetical protein